MTLSTSFDPHHKTLQQIFMSSPKIYDDPTKKEAKETILMTSNYIKHPIRRIQHYALLLLLCAIRR